MSIATIATYAILLIAMLVGLQLERQTRSFGVWKVLSRQVYYLADEKSRGLTSVLNRIGVGMVWLSNSSRGAYSGK